MISFRCGRCAEWVRAADEQAGRAVACGRCGHGNICPESTAALPAAPAARPASGPRTGRGVVWAMAGVLILAGVGWGVWSAFGLSNTVGAAATPASPVDARQQDILKQDIDRPGDPILSGMYQDINMSHFAGALPAMAVLWEPRLAEVGELSVEKFTLEGLFGHIGRRSVILLNTGLQSDKRALAGALCHEMVHAYLFTTGEKSTDHGPAFQAVLRRLADEGAFDGIVASDEERTNLRAWLDAESSRLDTEREDMDRLAADIDRERADVDRDLTDLNARITAANGQAGGWPAQGEIDAVKTRREEYNRRATDANARAERDQADLVAFNRQVNRYNLMLSYPDGLAGESRVKPKVAAPRADGR